MSYKYHGEPESKAFGPLPTGDYSFVVSGSDEPYQKNGHWILPVKLTIQPSDLTVFANPWSGMTTSGEARDGIAEFLLAINRAPEVGEEPNWTKLAGARGKCRLKVEVAAKGALAGQEVNKVAYFYRPKELKPSSAAAPKQEQQRQKTNDPVLDHEPDDIPF